MAILKTITDIEDFDSYDAFTTTTHVDTDRINYGYTWNNGESFHASWPLPVGNSIWLHWRYAISNFNSNWDDFGIFRFYDDNGDILLRLDQTNGLYQWVLSGDTDSVGNWRANDDIPFFWDINFVKNGTTDITAYIYEGGVIRATLTAANTADKGLPMSFNTVNTDGNAQGTCYMSEWIIADESTVGMRLRQFNVRSHGEISDWTGSALGMIERKLDRGMYSNTLNQRSQFGMSRTGHAVPDELLIDRMVLQTRAIRGSTGLSSFNPYFRWEGGNISDGTDVSLATDMRQYNEEFTTSPDTTNRWTKTEIDGLQVGVRART